MNFLKTLPLLFSASVLPLSGHAQTLPAIALAAAGSSAVFNAVYDAAKSSGVCGNNLWSQGAASDLSKGGILHDARNGHGTFIPDDDQKIWVAFDGTAAASFTDTTKVCL